MKVKDCMCHEVAYVNPDCSVEDCAKLMCNNHIGCIPVCNTEKQVVGLVTDRDILHDFPAGCNDFRQKRTKRGAAFLPEFFRYYNILFHLSK